MKYILIIFVLIIILGIFVIFKFRKKKKSTKELKQKYSKVLKQIASPANKAKEQIIDYDKIYHNILKDLGYNGTFGEILKSKPKEIQDIQLIWKLHKTRNKLVHDMEDMINESKLREYARGYREEVNKLIN